MERHVAHSHHSPHSSTPLPSEDTLHPKYKTPELHTKSHSLSVYFHLDQAYLSMYTACQKTYILFSLRYRRYRWPDSCSICYPSHCCPVLGVRLIQVLVDFPVYPFGHSQTREIDQQLLRICPKQMCLSWQDSLDPKTSYRQPHHSCGRMCWLNLFLEPFLPDSKIRMQHHMFEVDLHSSRIARMHQEAVGSRQFSRGALMVHNCMRTQIALVQLILDNLRYSVSSSSESYFN